MPFPRLPKNTARNALAKATISSATSRRCQSEGFFQFQLMGHLHPTAPAREITTGPCSDSSKTPTLATSAAAHAWPEA
jgi:hypothetical protein